MPTASNPLAKLASHSAKMKDLDEKRTALEQEACAFLGGLALEAGLGEWSPRDLKIGFAKMAKQGPSTKQKSVTIPHNVSSIAAE